MVHYLLQRTRYNPFCKKKRTIAEQWKETAVERLLIYFHYG